MERNSCFICWDEDSKNNVFIPTNICKCKTTNIHKDCFLKLEDKIHCCICKGNFRDFKIVIDNKIFEYKSYGITEFYKVDKNGKKMGLYRMKNYENITILKCFFRNGIRHGMFERYYSNGHIKEKGYVYNSKREGKYKKWHSNGILSSVKKYKKGMKHGIQEIYNDQGILILKQNYINDKLNGKCEMFYPKGNIKYEIYFKDGVADGRVKEWNMQGDIVNDFVTKNKIYNNNYKFRILHIFYEFFLIFFSFVVVFVLYIFIT